MRVLRLASAFPDHILMPVTWPLFLGIIYVSESELGWEPVVKSWLARRTDTTQVREGAGGSGCKEWTCVVGGSGWEGAWEQCWAEWV